MNCDKDLNLLFFIIVLLEFGRKSMKTDDF